MYEDSQQVGATPKPMPETSGIISRINNKLATLTDLLNPVINSNRGSDKLAEKPMGSSLVMDLRMIEEKITDLVDSINI